MLQINLWEAHMGKILASITVAWVELSFLEQWWWRGKQGLWQKSGHNEELKK